MRRVAAERCYQIMAVFAYRAVGRDAAAVSGMIVAESPRAARDTLRARGLTVHEVTVDGDAPSRPGVGGRGESRRPRWRFRTSASNAKTVSFIRELSTLLGVGIPLLEAIDTI